MRHGGKKRTKKRKKKGKTGSRTGPEVNMKSQTGPSLPVKTSGERRGMSSGGETRMKNTGVRY